MNKIYKPKDFPKVPKKIMDKIEDFLSEFSPLEIEDENSSLTLFYDKLSEAFYLMCHLTAEEFEQKADFKAALDKPEEDDEIYKLNRDISENESAFLIMNQDAKEGRTFEDIVVEYDVAYNPESPMKIYGGQHRIRAIQNAISDMPRIYHGFRIYFGLERHQKVEIATINNTSIAVSNDLLDRMREQMIGNELRNFFQKIDLLEKGMDFSDKRSPTIPTVRIARTFLINYFKGKSAKRNDFHIPIVCSTGGVDEEYLKIRKKVNWDDEELINVGKQFQNLHKVQREKVTNRKKDNYGEYARKALSLAVVASWSYAAGFYSKETEKQKILFSLTDDLRDSEDPLNAKALSEARLKGVDPDTYRGLGARISSHELGRMFEVIYVVIEKAKDKKITLKIANAAIQSFEAKRSQHQANKALEKI